MFNRQDAKTAKAMCSWIAVRGKRKRVKRMNCAPTLIYALRQQDELPWRLGALAVPFFSLRLWASA
jgi:hypothetical protein